MVGCGFPQAAGDEPRAPRGAARRPAEPVPGTTVNRFCASSLQTMRMAFHAINAGEGDVVRGGRSRVDLAGGRVREGRGGAPPELVGEGAIANVYIPMGMTAENVAEHYDV